MGRDNFSLGEASFTAGIGNVAGFHSVALGEVNVAGVNQTDIACIALGDGNTASGHDSFAAGEGCSVTGIASVALGRASNITGDGSFSGGWFNQIQMDQDEF